MSDDMLNLILQRLDQMERAQAERLEKIDQRFEQIDQRFGQLDQRLDRVEREQTRLRTDLLGQMERVLTTVQTFKDDMTVAMTYAARADASSDTTAALQRTMQSQISHLRNRVERLEDRRGDAG
ncbi:MAG TPA: hypothetical protein VGL95_03795 [Acetobacteraceae bacterium]